VVAPAARDKLDLRVAKQNVNLCKATVADAARGSTTAAKRISKSTLSRPETGQRRPSVEVLLPLAQPIECRWTSWLVRLSSAILVCV
jgi:transcriptional regulator with XRE-family HTH domain